MQHKKTILRKASGVHPAKYAYRGFIIDSYYGCGRNHWTGRNMPNDNKVHVSLGGWDYTIKNVQEKIDNYFDNQGVK